MLRRPLRRIRSSDPQAPSARRAGIHCVLNPFIMPRERFHSFCALLRLVKGGVFLRKTPLCIWAFGIEQLWNRCKPVS